MDSTTAPLRLKKKEERRLRGGHLWVFSNQVDTAATPLQGFTPGQPVIVEAHNGKPLGSGYVNPHSLICARLVSRDPKHALDRSLLIHRLKVALSLRERLYDRPFYRLVHGEGDFLPGLVVDRYGDGVVVQIGTAGMEAAREALVEALDKELRPAWIVFRNESEVREQEGLTRYTEQVGGGDAPETVAVEENGLSFRAPLLEGQKTGWFYDHRDNRARLAERVAGLRVLDVYSYVGGFAVAAAAGGAREVFAVDRSAAALDHLHANAEAAGVGERVTALEGDAVDAMKALREERERFDVVVLDPPAFIKRRKDMESGLNGYRRVNQLAMQLLNRDGLLLSASCSHHLETARLQELILGRARHLDRELAIVGQGHQGADHPVHPAIPETAYLKALFARVLPTQ